MCLCLYGWTFSKFSIFYMAATEITQRLTCFPVGGYQNGLLSRIIALKKLAMMYFAFSFTQSK